MEKKETGILKKLQFKKLHRLRTHRNKLVALAEIQDLDSIQIDLLNKYKRQIRDIKNYWGLK